MTKAKIVKVSEGFKGVSVEIDGKTELGKFVGDGERTPDAQYNFAKAIMKDVESVDVEIEYDERGEGKKGILIKSIQLVKNEQTTDKVEPVERVKDIGLPSAVTFESKKPYTPK